MPSRSSRHDPKYDDPYVAKDAYPDPSAGVNDDAFEYVGSDAFPPPPPHTYQDDSPRPSRRRSPTRHQRPDRASTLPPKSNQASPPPRSRRGASPPARTRYSDSPPRHHRSRRNASPPPRSSKHAKPTEMPQPQPVPPPAAAAGVPRTTMVKNKYGEWMKRPAVKNMKTYGRKGLNTLGEVVTAYAAAQAGPEIAGRGRQRYDDYDDPYEYDQPRRRRHRSLTPSPSPPPRRSAARRGERGRPPMNGRQKSYSLSPASTRKGYDSDDDHRRKHHGRRRSPSPSLSRSPPRRRHRSYSRGRTSSAPKESRRHASASYLKSEMRSPAPDVAQRWQLAARAALQAGGMTAFRLRKEPGSWTGQKGAKVVTAALGAAAMDTFIDKDPRRSSSSGAKGMAQSVVSGLLASKLMGVPSASNKMGNSRFR